MRLLNHINKCVEQKFGIGRAAGGFGVELRREERQPFVADSFVGTVVHVQEKRLPVIAQRIVVDGITVILGSDETFFRTSHAYRLVVAPVSVFEFESFSPTGFGE